GKSPILSARKLSFTPNLNTKTENNENTSSASSSSGGAETTSADSNQLNVNRNQPRSGSFLDANWRTATDHKSFQ
ncbi:unnamed protein product, partial [Amoebophrya sp. A120]